ncbi:GGDEF domain-containing protein [Allorhizobium sp. NPDC080224]|uniref:GGDEF domain-containing protein n=1 Tax=Allorhizobium sp. NPDC080224 TaxID=3390547 RepID=UPI003D0726F5
MPNETEHHLDVMSVEVFRKIVLEIADGVIGVSEQGVIRFANPAAAEIFGWQPLELVGKRLDILLPERARQHHDTLMAGFCAGTVDTRRMGQRGSGISGLRADGSEVNLGITILKTEVNGERLLVAVVRDITEYVRRQHELKQLAETDFLTGLLNRRAFFDEAGLLLAGQGDSHHSVAVFDLDHFKSVNDRFGHQIGDRVLELFATLLRQAVRSTDLVARLGGEEFIVLFRELSGTEAVDLAERVAEKTREQSLFVGGDRPITVTVSAGVATVRNDLAEALMRADAALYEAKRAGRDQVSTAA